MARPPFDLAARGGGRACRWRRPGSSAAASARRSRAAEEFLARVRSALHLETGKRGDRLVLDHQPAIAAGDGVRRRAPAHRDRRADAGRVRARARRRVRCSARSIERFHEDGAAPIAPPTTPAGVLEALAAEAEAGREPSAALLDSIDDLELPDGGGVGRGRACRVLAAPSRRRPGRVVARGPRPARDPRRVRARVGRRPLPPAARSVPPLHGRRTSDDLAPGDGPAPAGEGAGDDPVQAEAVRQLSEDADRDAVLLGALLHDIGKNGEGGHVAGGVSGRRVDPRTDGRRRRPTAISSDVHGRTSICCCPTPRPAGTCPTRTSSWTSRRRSGRPSDSPRSTSWRRPMPRRPDPRPGRRGGKRSSASSWRRSSTCSSAARWAPSSRSGSRSTDRRHPRASSPTSPTPTSNGSSGGCRAPTSLPMEPDRIARHYATIAPAVGAKEVRAVHFDGTRPGTYEVLVVARDRSGLLSLDRRRARPRRDVDPHRPRVHDRRRGRGRPVRGGRRAGKPRCPSVAGASSAACSGARSTARSRSSAGWTRSVAGIRRPGSRRR